MKAVWISRHHQCLGKERGTAAVMIGIIWAQQHIAYLMLCPSQLCMWWIEENRQRQRKETGRVGSPLCDTVSVRVKKRALCSQVSYALVTMPEGGGGGGGWVWRQQAMLTGCHTCFQQHYLIILTQLHEAVDALGELHHILNGLCYFDSTQLPHDFPGLRTDRTENWLSALKQ